MILSFAILCIQAAGSREPNAGEMETIRAEDILNDIRSGNLEPIDGAIINGDLDLRNLEDPIRGDIKIKNSIINGPVNFAGKTFEGQVDFSGTTFNDEVTLFDTQKNDNKPLYTIFEKKVHLVDTHFIKDADFKYVQFDGGNSFDRIRFDGKALFNYAKFSNGADFDDAQFKDIAFFTGAKFSNASVIFKNSCFEKDALFNYANFGLHDANFNSAKFSGVANFRNAEFNGDAQFNYTLFNGDASFIDAIFDQMLYLKGSKFGRLYIRWEDINGKLAHDDEVYLRLVENYKNIGSFADADNCYYSHRVLRRSNLSWSHKLLDLPLLAFYGYGVKPLRPIIWSFVVVLSFALWFWASVYRDCPLKRALKFSVKAFLSGTKPFSTDLLEFSKLEKKYKDRAVLERFLGTLFFLLFLITLANTVIIK
jgi:uncharacterized protein YjbI with pentapeptide repeats